MPPTKSCSFCQGPLGQRSKLSSPVDPRNNLELIQTLFKAANVALPLLTLNKNSYHSCAPCYELLLNISNNYLQLQAQLAKIKGILLQNWNRNSQSNRKCLQLLVKDLNPSLVLHKIVRVAEPCIQIQIKEEVEFDEYSEICSDFNFEDTLPHLELEEESPITQDNFEIESNTPNDFMDGPSCPELNEKLKPQFPPLPLLKNKRLKNTQKPSKRKTPTIKPPRIEENSEKDPEWEPPSSPLPKTKKRNSSPDKKKTFKRLKSKISSTKEKQESSESLEKSPVTSNRVRRSGYTQRRRTQTLDEHGQVIKLISLPNGAFSFNGIMITPVNLHEPKSRYFTKISQSLKNKFGKFKCEKCGQIMSSVYNLKGHIKMAHMGLERYGNQPKQKAKFDAIRGPDGLITSIHGIELVKTEENTYQCGSCHKVFKLRYSLLYHIHHFHAKLGNKKPRKVQGPAIERIANRWKSEKMPDGREFISGVEIVKVGDGTWKCGKCGRAWNQRGNVLTHIKKLHPESTPYPCTAPGCGAAFASKHLFNLHFVKHVADKAFVCERCGVSCKRKESLNDHILRVHEGFVRFQCPVEECSKQFFGRYDCLRHMNKHKSDYNLETLKVIKL